MGKREDVNVNTKRKLSWGFTDGKCCICSKKIGYFENVDFIGEFAHIVDLQKATLRYEDGKSINELNSINNLLVLCPTCHTKIDKQSENFSTSYLKDIKSQYENNIIMSREYSNPEYLEIFDNIYKDLKSRYKSNLKRDTLTPITITDKIAKNSLLEVSDVIEIGLSLQSNFIDYLNTISITERINIRKIIIEIYLNEANKNEISNIDKFNNMIKSLIGINFCNYLYAITILVYYFEECDVFET